MTIRPIEAPDIPAIAKLYEKLVRSGSDSAPPGLEEAFRRLFIDTPVYSFETPSLVLEVDGEIVGFQGVQTRYFELDATPRRLASLGPVFVIPELRARAAGAMLIKAAMNGKQDLTISDGAPEASRRLWEHLGGTLAVPQTLEWVLPLQPARLAARSLAQQRGGLRRWSGWAATPIATLIDKTITARWNVVQRPQRQVHLPVGQREVELVLALLEAVGVGGRSRSPHLFGNAQFFSQRVDLGLVQVGDRLDVGGAVAVLHEEALVVLQAVRRADYRVVQAIRVEILQRLADALLEVGRRDDLQVGVQRQTRLDLCPVRPLAPPARSDSGGPVRRHGSRACAASARRTPGRPRGSRHPASGNSQWPRVCARCPR
jgi:hypothetical protein